MQYFPVGKTETVTGPGDREDLKEVLHNSLCTVWNITPFLVYYKLCYNFSGCQFLWLSIWVYVSPPVSTQFRHCILQYVLLDFIFTTRKRSLGQGNIFSSMCQEFCSQGWSASVHAGIPYPSDQAPPGSRHPHGSRHPPRSRHPQTRHPHLGPGTHPREQTPLCSACWEIRSTSGRYASYWNAIFL